MVSKDFSKSIKLLEEEVKLVNKMRITLDDIIVSTEEPGEIDSRQWGLGPPERYSKCCLLY